MPTTLSAFTRRNLDEQGFGELDEAAKARNAWPLRFTPAVSISLIAIGLALQSPYWMGAMALVALSGALVPRGMIVDLVYNLGARYLLHAPPLPPTPRPRQFSYLISTAFLAGSAACFYVTVQPPTPLDRSSRGMSEGAARPRSVEMTASHRKANTLRAC